MTKATNDATTPHLAPAESKYPYTWGFLVGFAFSAVERIDQANCMLSTVSDALVADELPIYGDAMNFAAYGLRRAAQELRDDIKIGALARSADSAVPA